MVEMSKKCCGSNKSNHKRTFLQFIFLSSVISLLVIHLTSEQTLWTTAQAEGGSPMNRSEPVVIINLYKNL